jgi:uncharacterized repeat protein (TIGR01451 family)
VATSTPIIDADPIDSPIDIEPNIPGAQLPARTVLDDIADALVGYPANYVTLEIVDLALDGDIVNTGEEGSFRVKVTNNGPLTMKDVRLKAVGKRGTEVKSGSAGQQFADFVLSSNTIETLAGHGGFDDNSAFFIFEAPNGTRPEGTTLVEVTVEEWNALWDHTLNSHSRPSASPKVTFQSSVEVDD